MENAVKITIATKVAAPIEIVWHAWTPPESIVKWNSPSDD